MGQVAPLRLSAEPGYVTAPLALELRTDSSGAGIRYTLDGSAPDPDRSPLYLTPLVITQTTTLRARAFKPGQVPSPVVSASYIVLEQVIRQPAQPDLERFPPAWGHYVEGKRIGLPVPADYGMDPKVVDDPATAGSILQDLRSLPAISLVADPEDLWAEPGLFGSGRGIYANPTMEGPDWERPVSVEWIDPDGRRRMQIDAGLRIAGQWSRKPDSTPKHSFSLRFRERYGAGRLDFPAIPGSPVQRFETLRLRGGQADTFTYLPIKALYVHDQVGRDLQLDLGQPAARGRYVHVYLNGLYWGLYNLSEEVTARFAADHLGGREGDYDVVKALEVHTTEHGKPVIRSDYEMEDGDDQAFRALLALRETPPPNDAAGLAAVEQQLDLDAFAAYHILEIYSGNDDWLGKNWRALRRRGPVDDPAARQPGGRWTFLVWDIERGAFLRLADARCGAADHPCGPPRQPDGADIAATPGVMGLHGWLKGSVDYRLRFADQVRRLLQDGGPLTPGRVAARYRARLTEIDRAIVGESARWGDVYPREAYEPTFLVNATWWFTLWSRFASPQEAVQRRDPEWLDEGRRVLDEAVPLRTGIVLEQLCREQLASPVAGLRIRTEDLVPAGLGSRVAIDLLEEGCPGRLEAGAIHYTLDGSDPREPGSGQAGRWWSGRPSAGALRYARPFRAEGYRRLKARLAVEAEDGTLLWGPLSEAVLGRPRLEITELFYRPPDGEAEFLELRNLESVPVDLSGARFQGVNLVLPPGTVLGPLAYGVVTDSPTALRARYGSAVPILGEYTGGLSGDGERIRLLDADGRPLAEVTYSDGDFWPLAPDGHGFSLVWEPREGAAEPERWRASSLPGGSPGAPDLPPATPRILISEVLAASSPPYEDAIELYNPNLGPVDLGGWLLSDERDQLDKFRIPPRTVIGPGAYQVFYEADLRAGGAGGAGFSLSGRGEAVYLAAADARGNLTGYASGARFGAAEANRSLGRYQSRDGLLSWQRLGRPGFGVDLPEDLITFRRGQGAPDGPPQVGPVVLAELQLGPPEGGGAFAELANLSSQALALAGPDGRPWELAGTLNFRFPAGVELLAEGRLLVVAGDPAAFRLRHAVPESVPIHGPAVLLAEPRLRLDLLEAYPDGGDAAPPAHVLLERLLVQDRPPWPREPRGLERLEPPLPAVEPVAWTDLRPGGSPGRPNTVLRHLFLPWLGGD